MASFTLADIRAAAEAKYGALEIDLGDGKEVVRLLNPLRLTKEKRNHLASVQDRLDEEKVAEGEEVDHQGVIEDALRTVAETPGQGDRLVASADGDLAVLMQVFESYSEGTQVGEASPSDD